MFLSIKICSSTKKMCKSMCQFQINDHSNYRDYYTCNSYYIKRQITRAFDKYEYTDGQTNATCDDARYISFNIYRKNEVNCKVACQR